MASLLARAGRILLSSGQWHPVAVQPSHLRALQQQCTALGRASPLHRPVAWTPARLAAYVPLRAAASAAAGGHSAGSPFPAEAAGLLADLELPSHCSGCGVELQQQDPEGPGYFQVPKRLLEQLAAADDPWEEDDSELVFDDEWQPAAEAEALISDSGAEAVGASPGAAETEAERQAAAAAAAAAGEASEEGWVRISDVDLDLGLDSSSARQQHQLGFDDLAKEELLRGQSTSTSGRKGQQQAEGAEGQQQWDAFDSMVEGWLAGGGSERARAQVASYGEQEGGGAGPGQGPVNVLCARCYSLRHYGQVKSASAEASMPDFDFEKKVGRKLALQKFRRQVVLMVVDVADFDGSLPRQAMRSLLAAAAGEGGAALAPGRLPRDFRLVVAVNKSDLLPKQVTQARLEKWVRNRMAQGGLPRPSAVHVVSSTAQRRRGVRELLSDLQAAAGERGDVWVIGAQNAGKSSLINAMRAEAGLREEHNVTTAPLPGTTLGTVRVRGLLPSGCKMLDTPGVPHEFQLGTWLTAEEMRMVLPKRPLKPRTFRIAAGQSVSIGGLARIDVVESPGATMYLTVYVSDEIGCHFGKTEGAEERYAKHLGSKLAPPLAGAGASDDAGGAATSARLQSFPALVPTRVSAAGDSWQQSSMDVAMAGLGWVGIGCKGAAELQVWAPPRVAVTTHDALVPDYAKELERPGFGAAVTDTTARGKTSGGCSGKKGGSGGRGSGRKAGRGKRAAAAGR